MRNGVLTIATYNIHRCVGTDGRFRPDRTAEVIRELDADVVGLQEVDRRVGDGRPTLELEMLAGETGLVGLVGPTLVDSRGDYGNGLLTRLPVQGVRHVDLSVARREPRGAIDADLDAGGAHVRVVVTHLGLGIPERRHQVARLLHAIGAGSAARLVLVGDVNEWHPWSRSLRVLERALGPSSAGRTFPSRWPALALDRIWARPRAAVVQAWVHDSPLAREASDHLPLVARLRYDDDAP